MLNLASPEIDGDCYSDLYKEVYGNRPRGFEWADVAAFNADFGRLVEELKRTQAQEAEAAEAALVEYNARIARLMRDFNISVDDAIRWDMDAFVGDIETFQDVEHYFWLQGLSWAEVDRRTREWKDKVSV